MVVGSYLFSFCILHSSFIILHSAFCIHHSAFCIHHSPCSLLRLQFSPRQDPADLTAQLLELIQSAPVDEVMFFYFGEEQNNGHETLEEIQAWIEHSRPFRQSLKERGIAVSLNPGTPSCTAIQGAGSRMDKTSRRWWTPTVTPPRPSSARSTRTGRRIISKR